MADVVADSEMDILLSEIDDEVAQLQLAQSEEVVESSQAPVQLRFQRRGVSCNAPVVKPTSPAFSPVRRTNNNRVSLRIT